ncbi:MAG: bifunctional riboflavin kinase/FAD synthetase [Clostridia bacterium]|nr:bifunctional riboflavin kinase/FAD synthetase [Clostridia bacterium]
MQIFIQTDEKKLLQNGLSFFDTAVALGCFDAMHIGHREIIRNVVETAKKKGLKSLVYFFVNVPRSVLMNDHIPQINTLDERLSILEEMGVDIAVAKEVTPDFLNLSPEFFVKDILSKEFGAKYICAGFNYRFGKGGIGDADYLVKLGNDLGIPINVMPCVELDGEPVSSSRIRELLQKGRIENANILLGKEFSISGTVISGNHIGRTLGFPTVNLEIPKGKMHPAFGVYVTKVKVNNKCYPSITNVGTRPTIANDGAYIETHLLDFSGDLYEREITIDFHSYLRPIKKFENTDNLKKQLENDKQFARKFFKK